MGLQTLTRTAQRCIPLVLYLNLNLTGQPQRLYVMQELNLFLLFLEQEHPLLIN